MRTPEGRVDYGEDFFGKPAFLTVSGQLNGEYYACALSNIYTFGPTFRCACSALLRSACRVPSFSGSQPPMCERPAEMPACCMQIQPLPKRAPCM